MELRDYSHKIVIAYISCIRKFIGFIRSMHPCEATSENICNYLVHLIYAKGMLAFTVNQYINASRYLYNNYLEDFTFEFERLQRMATGLIKYPDLKGIIVGHIDADGQDASNLDFSKQRAASVKAALAKESSIDESQVQTDGKSESEPIDTNETPAGKANNRRVEFINI